MIIKLVAVALITASTGFAPSNHPVEVAAPSTPILSVSGSSGSLSH